MNSEFFTVYLMFLKFGYNLETTEQNNFIKIDTNELKSADLQFHFLFNRVGQFNKLKKYATTQETK